jgi:hypothetical protein
MAQETAGTIGIPVIKNEILPYLVDYSKRQQRAEEMEARRRAAAAKEAAKQAAEAEKAIKFDSEYGGDMFSEYTKNAQNNILSEYQKERQKVSGPAKTELGMEYSRRYAYAPKESKAREETIIKAIDDLNANSFRTIPKQTSYAWGREYSTKRKALPTIDDFYMDIGSNPDYVDLNKIGALSKNAPTIKRSVEDALGKRTTTFEGSPLYVYKLQKDQILNKDVAMPVDVDVDQVDVLLQGNKEAKAAMDLKLNTEIANNPTISPDQIKQKLYRDTFMPYKSANYGVAYTKPSVTNVYAGGGSKGNESIQQSGGVFASQEKIWRNGVKETADFEYGNPTDVTHTLSGPAQVSAGKKVVIFGGEPTGAQNALTMTKDGRYILNSNVDVKNVRETDVYVANSNIYDKDGGITYGAGTPLPNDIAVSLKDRATTKTMNIGLEHGYFVTGTIYDDQGDPIRDIRMFVPKDQAKDIDNAILGKGLKTKKGQNIPAKKGRVNTGFKK